MVMIRPRCVQGALFSVPKPLAQAQIPNSITIRGRDQASGLLQHWQSAYLMRVVFDSIRLLSRPITTELQEGELMAEE
ncbi:hypothetical protein M427DRAFT_56793 [Gonapodya prolifera JEL478]|uniref:Uncharacterized protein n=1 Tax=Gonapodya prolifera (strain JEL478) TaxID=1344416 RepID=A0A139AF91_GONPJ|nr:hypothetical protein M427DRAFT_56793 [Gonapodya prolifera JEL478]|eukprot:KXS15447.1 hypothetical protein M427DRAFT_56793 [Gonapodya prolifera JEL478]